MWANIQSVMSGRDVVASYIMECTAGQLPFSECGPLWQFGFAAGLGVVAVAVFIALKIGVRDKPDPG